MATQYTSILKLALPTQGELSGTWGDVVNDNITSMVEEAIAGRSVINSWAANSHTLTTADGLTSESRAAMLEFTDTGTALSGAATVICPTATKIYVCKNGAGQTVTVKTAAGTGVAIPNGETMFVFCDGTNVVQAVTSLTTLKVGTGIQVSTILDEDNMASDSATALATQQSIKAYVDAQITAQDLDFAGDTGTGAVDLDSQTFTVAGTANEIETSASGQTITIGLPTAIVVTTITTTNVQATNIKANDGTAAITIADSTGQVTVTDAVLTTADINGGTADNVTIGGSTAAAGSFTTLGASGTTSSWWCALALTGNLDINTNKFNVTAADGNTLIAGTLGVTGNVDLNGGAIDGTVIGGSTAAAVTGTTIVANTSIEIAGTTTVSSILDEDNMASDSDTALATQQSIKAYVDSQVGTVDTLAEILANGNTSGATDLVIDSGQVLTTNTINETTAASGVTIDSVLLKDDGVNATNLEITNLKANDGTSAGSIADSTGVVTLASSVLTTTDINGGTIDGTVIGGSTAAATAAAITGTTITGTSFVSSGDMTFGDNDKAIFGAGSDLQIYHDGSNSWINEVGTGQLILAGEDVRITTPSAGEFMATFGVNGAATLYYDNASKLATTATGIDVTGTVTADGLTVDTGSTFSITGSFGGATNKLVFLNDDGGSRNQIDSTTSGGVAKNLDIATGGTKRATFVSNGNVSLYEDTGTTAKFFWDASAESLGIGRTPVAYGSFTVLDLAGSAGAIQKIIHTGSTVELQSYASSTVGAVGTATSHPFLFTTGDVERMRIDSSGNLILGGTTAITDAGTPSLTIGNGAGNPSLNFYGTSAGQAGQISFGDATSGTGAYEGYLLYDNANNFMAFGTNHAERARIDSSGNVGIGVTPSLIGSYKVLQIRGGNTSDGGLIKLETSDGTSGAMEIFQSSSVGRVSVVSNLPLAFNTNNTERARIDSSGNLLVGKTSVDTNTAGFEARSTGFIGVTRADVGAYFTRLTTDGEIIQFRKDSAEVGSIGVAAGPVAYMVFNETTSDNVAALKGAGGAILPSTNAGADKDGTMNLGSSGARFENLYLSGGVYLGGTVAANLLDDYEEGTWTPSTTVGLTSTYARYTKVGNRVFFDLEVTITTNSNAGQMQINALPFAASGEGSATLGYTTATVSNPILMVQGTGVYFYSGGSSIVAYSTYSNKIIRLTGTYMTTA
jgi:hypothetical protein